MNNISWTQHIFDPFAVEGHKIKNWQKALAIGVGLSLAPFLIIPGFLAMYAISGYFKNRMIKQLSSSSDDTDKVARQVLLPATIADESPSKAKIAFSAIDATYPNFSDERCCDFAYSDPKSKFIAVFDAAGHNNFEVHKEQVPAFEKCCERIALNLSRKKFKNVDAAKQFLREEIGQLSKDFEKIQEEHILEGGKNFGTKYAGPALMCGFPVRVGKQTHFVYSQVADCSLCYKSGEKVSFIAEADDVGLADFDFSGGRLSPTIRSFEVEKQAEIYLFSDGIGEFLTRDEFVEIIEGNPPEKVLSACKTAITEGKVDTSTKRVRIAQRPGMKAPSLCKDYDAEDRGKHDDLSLAYLKIN
ncbi:MAG: hypothetical protein ACSNEK_09130 [Parachlamydiaceae bacterium]